MWLVRVQPSFARRWFRLWFASADRVILAELTARVVPVSAGVSGRGGSRRRDGDLRDMLTLLAQAEKR